ncbi:hypothetical protein BCE75_110171 [Isoptericola sp. CG 20/1183]|uniref:Uncharacterized protein n=1 Tax=Isoptericola halotolerans TaxID=300560 RepID=A0ABX5EAR3_9MICO|nr:MULTISPECIES: hypothetical protein [Isoptericola]MCK0115575.1 hypothetical protein [Isoptericola sp. S6320L]PRZ04349.1 hypothetical protein BCL65_11010 [Isoptericola halotolerans]PRZ04753.1 hypothetical protein BCE75_110171 [Isoptericola sp. CG 20/1183]
MTSTELADLRRAIEQLRHTVVELHHAFGDVPAVRRLRNDLERLEIDAGELLSAPPSRADSLAEHVVVPDTPLDESMWSGADDEGVGGYHGDRP